MSGVFESKKEKEKEKEKKIEVNVKWLIKHACVWS